MIFISTEPKDANTKYEKSKLTGFSFIKAYQNLFELNCRTTADRVNLPWIYELASWWYLSQEDESPKFAVRKTCYYYITVLSLLVVIYRKKDL